MTLSFELVKDTQVPVLEVFVDREGISLLKAVIEKIERHNGPWHEHLMTPSWSGNELTEVIMGEGNTLVNQVTISLMPEEK